MGGVSGPLGFPLKGCCRGSFKGFFRGFGNFGFRVSSFGWKKRPGSFGSSRGSSVLPGCGLREPKTSFSGGSFSPKSLKP